MVDVRLDMTGDSPVFDFSNTVVNFDATVQKAMVNLGTDLGSDPVFTDRGTYILMDAVQGRMVNLATANHAANFAASRTAVFVKSTTRAGDDYGLQSLDMSAPNYNMFRLQLNITATCVDGETRGVQPIL